MFANRQGLASLLKDGYKTFTGIDEVTAKNIEVCNVLTNTIKTSLGPCGLGKLIVTSLGKKYVTNDTACIVKELEVQHPAAKILAMAADMQKMEMGGGVNFMLVFAGQLMANADYLLRQGLHLSDVLRGYEIALDKVPDILKDLLCYKVTDMKDPNALKIVLMPVIASKPLCAEIGLCGLLSNAICAVMPQNPQDFDPENIRVAKLQGGALSQTCVVNGIVVTRPPNGYVEQKNACRVMVLGCGLECTSTEAKATVLLHSASELKNFSKGEEIQMENAIKNIKDAGVEAIIVHGGGISDVAQHYCDKYEILTLRIQSKFEARRLCKALGATALVRLGTPMADELGVADQIMTLEISSKKVTQILCRDTRVQTVILRGATPAVLDEAEKCIDDACAFAKALTKDGRFVAGAGAVEIEISKRLNELALETAGVEQYAVIKVAESFEIVPRILAESCGQNATDTLALLHREHSKNEKYVGVDIEIEDCFTFDDLEDNNTYNNNNNNNNNNKQHNKYSVKGLIDSFKAQIFDHYLTKLWAVKLAADAALTILRVDQIIMARMAGGPNPRQPGAPDLD